MNYYRLASGVLTKRIALSCNGNYSLRFGNRLVCRATRVPQTSTVVDCRQFATSSAEVDEDRLICGQELATLNHAKDQGLARLIEAYRVYGHRKANINSLQENEAECPELNPNNYGLFHDAEIKLPGDGRPVAVSKLVEVLENVFCGTISVESGHLETASEREFLSQAFMDEKMSSPTDGKRKEIAKLMIESEAFDHFVHTKFKTVKRYGGEGAESAAVFSDEIFRAASLSNIDDVIIGMPHRGRQNLLAMQLKLQPEIIFRKIKGLSEFPDHVSATGDVLSHLTSSCDLDFDGSKVHVTMLPCPSHLEAINAVALGKCFARQKSLSKTRADGQDAANRALCFLMHGDAAIAGQGIVAECFNMSNLPHFSVGGTVHLIVNNQLGFTTPSVRARSSRYASDIAKSVGCPVLHVNGYYPEDVARAARIALKYRNTFGRDVVVDMNCYRKWGHNEMDDPSFTQPLMYRDIESRPSPPESYASSLVSAGLLSSDEVAGWKSTVQDSLTRHLKNAESFQPTPNYLEEHWSGMQLPSVSEISSWDTGYPAQNLNYIAIKSVEVPENHSMHPRLEKMYADGRKDKITTRVPVDWATAEAISFGSLLQQGYDIRICGQDVGRGTFSQRHVSVICQDSENSYIPLNHLSDDQTAKIEVVNSLLTEEAVLGFEYGVSVENPNRLVIWEAQFGDFFNGAQIIIDTFLASGEAKWLLQSGLVMLLPHGYDGMGPEHSSCRIERFLQMTDSKENGIDSDDINFHFCHPTTPAQYFHLLRRQMVRNYRKPLIVASPKTLLRLPAATSAIAEMAPGTSFQPVLSDPAIIDKAKVKTVMFCSGKHYYALKEECQRLKLLDSVAIVRLEELCPFPAELLRKEVASFANASAFVWAQEEPRNMGAWNFVNARFENIIGVKLRYAGRPVLPTPAVGIGFMHKNQTEEILVDAFHHLP